MYKVADLIAELQKMDPELPVLLQKDPEGNGFFWARGADDTSYVPKTDLESDRTDEVVEVEDTGAVLDPNMEPETRAHVIAETGYIQVAIVFP